MYTYTCRTGLCKVFHADRKTKLLSFVCKSKQRNIQGLWRATISIRVLTTYMSSRLIHTCHVFTSRMRYRVNIDDIEFKRRPKENVWCRTTYRTNPVDKNGLRHGTTDRDPQARNSFSFFIGMKYLVIIIHVRCPIFEMRDT